jgi:hypothetical protein
MVNRSLIKYTKIWWEGFKIFCGLFAFGIVLFIVELPILALTGLVGEVAGRIIGIVFLVFLTPIIFYFISRYLVFWSGEERKLIKSDDDATDAGEKSNRVMRGKIIISSVIAFIVAAILSPPDPIAALTLGTGLAFLCAVTLLVLARFKFMKSSPSSMHTVVSILVCTVLVLLCAVWLLRKQIAFLDRPFPDSIVYSVSSSAAYTTFNIGNLWIVHSSNQNDSSTKKTDYVICSESFPKSCRYDGSDWMFSFSDKSIGFSSSRDDTIWIDEQHELRHLGPILGKEDVAILRDYRYDDELQISSPEELLTIVDKLKTERATKSVQPQARLGRLKNI